MKVLSAQELNHVSGGSEDACSWKNFGKSMAEGAIVSGIVGAGMGSVVPAIGTGLGAASGAALGAVGGAAAHVGTCWW
ncbi:bacteriocin [Neisseria sp.]|uniref:bacteriocin n=1 Tax=Neisseria sp. TaxID=192066 RepID=UPI0026DC6F76|nr:bacteriocin [Neisseria sp.]MDO4907986.1 Blp family class II bacteriocin [Neisseria sp.]